MTTLSIEAASQRVGTIGEMQAVTPKPGRMLTVLGPQGGTFYATSGGEPCDGGIAFAYDGDLSSLQNTTKTASNLGSDVTLAANLAFGSVSIGADPYLLTDLHLHGHGTSNHSFGAWIDHATGVIAGGKLNSWAGRVDDYGDGPGANIPISYKTVGNARRWVRQWDGETVQRRWFGEPDADDARDMTRWCLNAAARLGAKQVSLGGLEWPIGGMLEIPDGIELIDGGLKIPDGYAEDHFVTTVYGDQEEKDKLPEYIVNAVTGWIAPACSAARFTLRRVSIDGNVSGNAAVVHPDTRAAYLGGDPETVLRNAPTWGGVCVTNQNSRAIADPTVCLLDDVDIHDFGSNCLLGHGYATFDGSSNVRVGNSAANHVSYAANGVFDKLTIYGFAKLGYVISYFNVFTSLVAKGLVDNPYWAGTNNSIVVYRGLDYGDGSLSSDPLTRRVGCRIDNIDIDLPSGMPSAPVFGGLGPGFSIGHGTVLGRPDGTFQLLAEQGNGNQTGLNRGWAIEDVRVLLRGGGCQVLGELYGDACAVAGVTIANQRSYATPTTHKVTYYAEAIATERTGDGWAAPRSLRIGGLTSRIRQAICAFNVNVADADAKALTVYVTDSSLLTTSNTILRAPNGNGQPAGLTQNLPSLLRFFWERSAFSLGVDTSWANLELFLTCSRFLACENEAGLKSEDGGSVTASAASGGETTYDITTSLFWVPESVANVVIVPRDQTAAARLAQASITFRNSANNATIAWGTWSADYRSPKIRLTFPALTGGDVLAFDWRAAVKPW